MLDYHLHLWPHGDHAPTPTLDQLADYCEHAATHGVTEIALTEHLFRFRQADVLAGFWADDPNPILRHAMAEFWHDEMEADLDQYVETVLAAKAAGLPVVLGLEVDHYRGAMDRVATLLDGYPFDVLLGSVHWIGAWGFDNLGDPVQIAEWDARGIENVWGEYTDCLEELAASGVCDVLAHPDLPKLSGKVPQTPDEFYDRMAEAAARSSMAAEVSSGGFRKPVNEAYPAPALLGRFHARGVPITTASDAHRVSEVASRGDELRVLLRTAGYDSLTAYRSRVSRQVPV